MTAVSVPGWCHNQPKRESHTRLHHTSFLVIVYVHAHVFAASKCAAQSSRLSRQMHALGHSAGLESSKNIIHSNQIQQRPGSRAGLHQQRHRQQPSQHTCAPAPAPTRQAGRQIPPRLRPPRYRQLQDQHHTMVLLESSPPQLADEGVGVGTPLPHLQDCVYLGEKQLLLYNGVMGGVGHCFA